MCRRREVGRVLPPEDDGGGGFRWDGWKWYSSYNHCPAAADSCLEYFSLFRWDGWRWYSSYNHCAAAADSCLEYLSLFRWDGWRWYSSYNHCPDAADSCGCHPGRPAAVTAFILILVFESFGATFAPSKRIPAFQKQCQKKKTIALFSVQCTSITHCTVYRSCFKLYFSCLYDRLS